MNKRMATRRANSKLDSLFPPPNGLPVPPASPPRLGTNLEKQSIRPSTPTRFKPKPALMEEVEDTGSSARGNSSGTSKQSLFGSGLVPKQDSEEKSLPLGNVKISVKPTTIQATSYQATVILTPETPADTSSGIDKLRHKLLSLYDAPLDGIQYQNKYNLSWSNPQAVQRVYQTITALEKDPDSIVNKCGGAAIWKETSSISGEGSYHDIMVVDSHELRLLPKQHVSCVILGVKLPLSSEKYKNINKIHPEAQYDASTQILHTSSDYFGGALLIAVAVKLYKEGYFSKKQASMFIRVWDKKLRHEWLHQEEPNMDHTEIFDEYLFDKH